MWQGGGEFQGADGKSAFNSPATVAALKLWKDAIDSGAAPRQVNAGGFDANQDDTPFADLHGPGLRAIYDLADPDRSMFQLALGQSAHPLSPHYDDMEELWLRNEGLRIGREPAGDILTLMP